MSAEFNLATVDMQRRLAILRDRGFMLSQARDFFKSRQVCEVDCPLLSLSASIDAHIDLIPAQPFGETRHLHSSPEYGMKRLLAEGMGDIFQLSHVFRNGEMGTKHNPEFTMCEWYRLNISFDTMIQETLAFIQLFLGVIPNTTLSYREAFQRFANIDYIKASSQDLLNYIRDENIEHYSNIEEESKDDLLNLILAHRIEPNLGTEGLCVLTYYPATQAALAQTYDRNGEMVGERFEIYYRGIELANGYHELADPIEQRKRLEEANKARIHMGKNPLPLDENFLQALKVGLPDCCGVAVGFDRLMMLRHNQDNISKVISFSWNEA